MGDTDPDLDEDDAEEPDVIHLQDSLQSLSEALTEDFDTLQNLADIDSVFRDKPAPFVFITDPGQDQDDEIAMVLSKTLSDIGLVEVKCVVANLKPEVNRAKLAKGTLNVLNMGHVPVGIGTDGNSDRRVDNFS